MARNGSGTYVPTNGTWTNGAANGVLATLTDWQALLNDLVAAISQSVSKDGQTVMTGDLPMGGFKLTGLGAGTGTGQTLTFEQLFSQGTEADIASAATTDIGLQNSNFLRITGNTTISSFGTNYRGPRFLRFAGAVTLTNSSTLVLPGASNITTAAGDCLIAIPGATSGTADKWIVAAYQANGLSVTINGIETITGTKTFQGTPSTIAMVINDAAEVTTISATAATGTINYDITTQSVVYYTSNAAGNWTVNFRASSGTSLNTALAVGQSVTVAFLVTQGSTAFFNNVVQVDGTTSGVTTRWLGGAPEEGNAVGIDSYRYLIIKTGNAAFTVLASKTQFKA
jgi:hypothetical protein